MVLLIRLVIIFAKSLGNAKNKNKTCGVAVKTKETSAVNGTAQH